MLIRVNRIIPKTTVEGPGLRFCLWVQGCSIHCPGCGAPQTWDLAGGVLLETEHIFNQIKEIPNLEGITFLGGEPFLQACALYTLAKSCKDIGLTVLTFSGYTYEHIVHSNRDDWNQLLSMTDLLIDGPFDQEKFDLSRPWVGSSNQNFTFLSSAYRDLEKNLHMFSNQIEVRVQENGTVLLNGMGDFEKLKGLL